LKKFILKSLKIALAVYLLLMLIQIGFVVPARSFHEPEIKPEFISYRLLGKNGWQTTNYPGSKKIPLVSSYALQGKGTSYEKAIPYQFRFRLAGRPLKSFILVSEYTWFSFVVGKQIDSFVDGKGWQRQNRKIYENKQLTDWQQFILLVQGIWSPQDMVRLRDYHLEVVSKDGLPHEIIDRNHKFVAVLRDWNWHYGVRLPNKILFYKKDELKLRLMVDKMVLSSGEDLWELEGT